MPGEEKKVSDRQLGVELRRLTKTPTNHDNAQPEGWACPLHHDVAWNFCSDVEREENSQCNLRDYQIIDP
jgi:hypothetical protein